jgi:hypothetical protein
LAWYQCCWYERCQYCLDQIGSTVTLSTTADTNSHITFNPGIVNLTNEYLFFQTQWEETTAGSSNADTVLFHIGTAAVTTTNWTANLLQTAGAANGAASVAAAGSLVKSAPAQMDGAASTSITGSAIASSSAQMNGAASVSFAGTLATVIAGSFQADGTSTAAITGSTVRAAALQANGVAAASFTGIAVNPAKLNADGIANGSFAGIQITPIYITANGISNANFGGLEYALTSLTVNGVASATFTGSLIASGSVIVNGVSTANFTIQGFGITAARADGIATAAFTGKETASAALQRPPRPQSSKCRSRVHSRFRPAGCADERHEGDRSQILLVEAVFAIPDDLHQFLDGASFTDRNDKTPADFQLPPQCFRNFRTSRGDQGSIEGRCIGPPQSPIAMPHLDVAVVEEVFGYTFEADFFYVANPEVTVKDVAKMQRLSKAVGELLDAAA